MPSAIEYFGLIPQRVIERGWIWQLVTYMFLHGGALHILFNMLGIWMFGVELERRWGTRFFLQVLRGERHRWRPHVPCPVAAAVRRDRG